ncbi:Uma2 family endonuclease [Tautonia plasticadhaerens]|uniref:Putative restriction endonuclease domain-containing protein n=1 Tax=Tautonia plasticadhaerens TaxID=2527974 RepID=A0A518GUI6_9BACT|nr:Uma2 family endonuclease [Tautonia plasticadhaerens]QDV32234.1 hypothetical protein ElP_00570 [Tautonia plasticadhaerens]
MSAEVAPRRLVTSEEFFALPDDGIDRDLIDGVVVEWGKRMTRRHRKHGRVEAQVSYLLKRWLFERPEPRGEVVAGEVYFRLRRPGDPEAEANVGIDVAYVSAGLVAATADEATFFDGPPVLAVEILSPSNTQEEIDDKVALYLAAGVPIVWVINTRYRTITIYRPDAEPELVNALGELAAEPHLPGFRVEARRVFE